MKYREKFGDIFHMSFQAFIICILIIVPSIAAMCFKFVAANRDDTISRSQRTVHQINQSVDMALCKINEAILQLTANSSVVNYMDYYNTLDYSVLLKTDEYLSSFMSINPYIQDISIYFFDQNMVYSPNSGVYNLDEFYDKSYIYTIKNNPSEAKSIKNRFITKANGSKTYEVITIVKTVPLVSNTPKAIIVVNVLHDYFESFIRDSNIDEGMNILLVNDRNESVINLLKDNTVDLEALSRDFVQHNEQSDNSFSRKIHNQDSIVSYSISSYSNWKCVGIIPYNAVYKGLYSLWLFVIILTIVLLVVSVILSMVFAIKMYKPLDVLAGYFTSVSKKEKDNNIHEYIKSNVSYVLEKNKLLEDSLKEYQPVIKGNFITNLMMGALEDGEQALRQIVHFNLDLNKHQSYVVYVISYSNHEKYINYSHNQKVMMQIYILEILNTFIASNYNGIACESGINEISVILNHPCWTFEECSQNGKEIHFFLLKNMKYATDITIGMGNSVDDIMNIPDSRLEAMHALHISFIMSGNNKFICFKNIQQLNSNYYSYPYRKEQELINHLKKCDIDSARKTFDEIILPLTSTDAYISSYVSIQLLCSIVRLVNELGGKPDMYDEEFNIYKILSKACTIEDIRTFFNTLLQKVIMFIIDKRDNKNKFLIEKIVNYIDENYGSDISLEVLAEQVFFSTTYLSKLFKQETGMNIKEYIDKVRLDKAKAMLRNPKYSIQQVGDLIGYTQSQSFIKFFKRQLGITPGEFRGTLSQVNDK